MRISCVRRCAITLLLAPALAAAANPKVRPIDAARVDRIAAMLDDQPFIAGPAIDDRAGWAKLAAQQGFQGYVARAEAALAKPMPAMTAEVYGEYLKTGTRTKHYRDVREDRYGRIAIYTLAECIEDKGRFIAPLQEAIRSVCDEPTWTFNFHDTKLDYWNRRSVFVDLGAFMPALDMTEAAGLLKDKLDGATRTLIHDECCRRILDPYRASLTGTGPAMWWMNVEMNWNPVCTYGVLGVALGTAIDRRDRALFLAGAEMYEPDFIKGFGGDGYCAEGMGYWNYGFGHFLFLAELASQATHGKLDLYAIPGARLAAMYPVRMAIVNGVTPRLRRWRGRRGTDEVAVHVRHEEVRDRRAGVAGGLAGRLAGADPADDAVLAAELGHGRGPTDRPGLLPAGAAARLLPEQRHPHLPPDRGG